MGNSPGGRLLTIVVALLVVGFTLRLIGGVLAVLPQDLLQGLGEGWRLLYSWMSPSVRYAAALAFVWAAVWVFTGKWRRR